ncbi:hypothetical protein Dehly_1454 [Dehalogenimonas lykanthroporepellens BL-DC-9]|nr:hypothetical protein Dehly_1454 [Dehalogenimonas lykanthroporepellens BL-DC-9]
MAESLLEIMPETFLNKARNRSGFDIGHLNLVPHVTSFLGTASPVCYLELGAWSLRKGVPCDG